MSLLNHEVEKKKKNKNKRNKPSSSSSWAWKVHFVLKPKFFKFIFKATNILPSYSSKIPPFSINFALTITKSDTHNSKSTKSKFLWFFRKLGFRRAKRRTDSAIEIFDFAHRKPRFFADRSNFFAFEEPNYVASIAIGFIGLLSRSISQKDQKGLIFYGSIIVLLFAVIIIISLQKGNAFTDYSIFHFCN